jgi:hypothetical protein
MQRRTALWCRMTAACVALVFSVGMSRHYLVIPLNQFLCLEATGESGGGAAAIPSNPVAPHSHSHGHNHDHGPTASQPVDDDGFIITHCKDEIRGIALTSLQMLGTIETEPFSAEPIVSSILLPADTLLSDFFISDFFQPPRA